MKKIISLVLAAALMLVLVACGGNTSSKLDGMTPQQVIDKVYEGVDQNLIPMVGSVDIDSTNETYYLGAAGLSYESAVASEALINAVPFSLCVIKMKDGANVDAAKTEIKNNVNPNKWICVGVDAKNVVVDSSGSYIILILSDDSAAFHDSFNKLVG